MKEKLQESFIKDILKLYGLNMDFSEQKEYITYNEDGDNLVKIIFSVEYGEIVDPWIY